MRIVQALKHDSQSDVKPSCAGGLHRWVPFTKHEPDRGELVVARCVDCGDVSGAGIVAPSPQAIRVRNHLYRQIDRRASVRIGNLSC